MKIAQVIAISNHRGGDQTHVLELTEGLVKRGHKCVVLLGPSDGRFETQLNERGVEVYPVPSLFKPINPWRDGPALFELLAILRRVKPDVIAAHTSKAGYLGRVAGAILGIPAVFTPHGWSVVDRESGRINKGFRVLERAAGRLGASVIAVSQSEREVAVRSGLTPPGHIHVVYNGIADEPLPPRHEQAPPVVIMVARFQKQKDPSTLLRAMALLKDQSWTLQFVGAGPLLDQCRDLALRCGIAERVQFLGERGDTEALLRNADIFVLSSNWEAFPISTLEAMRAELPVVVSDVGGAAEAVVEGETGFVVAKGDHCAMAKAVAKLLQDDPLRKLLGANSRARFLERFTLGPMIDATLAVYEATCARKHQHSPRNGRTVQAADSVAGLRESEGA